MIHTAGCGERHRSSTLRSGASGPTPTGPPVPLAARPLLELANFITVGLLPAKLRRQYGLRWDPIRGLILRAGAEYTRRLLVPVLPRRVRYAADRAAA